MRSATQAYAAVAKELASPRELEASLLLKAASRLQAVQESWDDGQQLGDALLYNRKLWTILVASITTPGHPLPAEIRRNVATLALFVFKHTIAMMANPRPDQLTPLISINRHLAAGLRANG